MNTSEFVASCVGIPSFFESPLVGPGQVAEGMPVVAGAPIGFLSHYLLEKVELDGYGTGQAAAPILDAPVKGPSMTDDIIGMGDMMAVYEVTDLFGIDRETISVPLEKSGTGAVERQPDGGVEITVPATTGTREWLPALRSELELLGFELQDEDEDDDEY